MGDMAMSRTIHSINDGFELHEFTRSNPGDVICSTVFAQVY